MTVFRSLEVLPVVGMPEIRPGDDVARHIVASFADLRDGDVVVVTSKIISKSEGRVLRAVDRATAIERETSRVVARRGDTRIVETRHGFVLAAAGVDASNTEADTVLLLPEDPDASARVIRASLREQCGRRLAVIVSDTFGRPWRQGLTDVALGVAGMEPLEDYRGQRDAHGNLLEVTVTAIVDELAAAAELVKGKLAGIPVAIVRGLSELVLDDDGPGAGPLVRPLDEDMFRYGSREVVFARRTVRSFTAAQVDRSAVLRAVEAALAAPAPHHTTPWRFVLVESADVRERLLDAMLAAWAADLRRDGFDEAAIARRTRRGDVLRRAACLAVPCLVPERMHSYPDRSRASAEEAMFLLAMGAGIENFLVALAVEGIGSAWVSSTLFCPDVVRAELELPPEWRPMGAVAMGYADTPATDRPPRTAQEFTLFR